MLSSDEHEKSFIISGPHEGIHKVKSWLYVSLIGSSLEDTKIAVKEEVREEECSEWQPDRSHHPSVKEEQYEGQLIEKQGTCFISY